MAALPSQTILKEGWGIKEGARVRNWKRRYFVLRAVDKTSLELLYFKEQTEWLDPKKSPKGSVAIDRDPDNTTVIGESFAKGQGRCITIDLQGQGRQYRLIPDGGNGPWLRLLCYFGEVGNDDAAPSAESVALSEKLEALYVASSELSGAGKVLARLLLEDSAASEDPEVRAASANVAELREKVKLANDALQTVLTAGNAKAVQGMVREYVLGLSEKWREENDVEAKEGPSALGLQPRKARMKRGVKSAFTGTFDAGWKALIKVHEGILMGNKAGASKVARGLGTGGKHIIKAGFSGYSEFLRGALGMSSLQIEAHDLDAFTAGLQGLKAAGDPLLMGFCEEQYRTDSSAEDLTAVKPTPWTANVVLSGVYAAFKQVLDGELVTLQASSRLATQHKQVFKATIDSSKSVYEAAFMATKKKDPAGYKSMLAAAKKTTDATKSKFPQRPPQPLADPSSMTGLKLHAAAAHGGFKQILLECKAATHPKKVTVPDTLKKFVRIFEKFWLRNLSDGQHGRELVSICDVVRALVRVKDFSAMMTVHDWLMTCDAIEIVDFKDRVSERTKGGWSDCVYLFRRKDGNGHICEVQVALQGMVAVREQMEGHAEYGSARHLMEMFKVNKQRNSAPKA